MIHPVANYIVLRQLGEILKICNFVYSKNPFFFIIYFTLFYTLKKI